MDVVDVSGGGLYCARWLTQAADPCHCPRTLGLSKGGQPAPPPSRLTSTIYGLMEVGNNQSAIQKVRKPVRSPSWVKRLTPPYHHTMVLGHQISCSYLETWFRTFSWKCLHGSQVFGSRVVTSNSSNFESSVKRLKFWRTFGEHLNVPYRKGYNANLDRWIKGYFDSVRPKDNKMDQYWKELFKDHS